MIIINNKYLTNTLILILVFTIFINFIIQPKKVEASAIALEGGKAVLLLLLASLGITVATQTDLEGLYGELDWDAMILPSHLNIGDYTKLPEEPPDYNKILKYIIAGGTAVAVAFSDILDDIKEWFQEKGSTVGDNEIIIDDFIFIDELGRIDFYSLPHTRYYNGSYVTLTRIGNFNEAHDILKISSNIESLNNKELRYPIKNYYQAQIDENHKGYTVVEVTHDNRLRFTIRTFWRTEIGYVDIDENEGYELPKGDTINYNILPSSSVITDIPPTTIPQPNIGILPNIQEQITPHGEKKYIYPGTMDDLVTDLNNNITLEDLIDLINNNQDGSSTSYTLTESQQGVQVDYGTTKTPYPNIDIEPIEDTSEFQGKNIGILKSIVNWLSNIYYNLTEIPQKIGDLFYNSENVESIDFTPITNVSISDKFPFSIPWDLKESVEMLASEGKAPKWEVPIVTETITIDMEEFEQIASIIRVFITLLFVVALIILTRRLI